MKKLLIILLILVIVFLVVFVFGNRPVGEETSDISPTPTTTSSPQSSSNEENNMSGDEGGSQDLPTTHVVEIFDDRFNPTELSILVGDTVQFVNEGTRKHWPASGVHPTHTICPGFDALKGLNPGETYEFTFNKVETCPMHDHLQPSLKGEIIIEAR